MVWEPYSVGSRPPHLSFNPTVDQSDQVPVVVQRNATDAKSRHKGRASGFSTLPRLAKEVMNEDCIPSARARSMTLLDDRVLADGRLIYGDIVDVHTFLTHRVDIALGMTIGTMFYREAGMGRSATMVLTAATSGIAPSIFAAVPLCVPLVFAHKEHGITMGEVYTADAPSPTKGGIVTLHVSKDVIGPSDRIVIYDDFLASAATILALVDICKQAGATVASIGVVIEKTWMNGRVRLESLGVPVYAACKVAIKNKRLIII